MKRIHTQPIESHTSENIITNVAVSGIGVL